MICCAQIFSKIATGMKKKELGKQAKVMTIKSMDRMLKTYS